jgi:hypothetical protein
VEQVLGDVPRADRCRCREKGATRAGAAKAGAAPATAVPSGAFGKFRAWLQQ